MPRSGSTLLFNLLRSILSEYSEKSFSSGWIRDIHQLESSDTILLKAHELSYPLRKRSSNIFYTYRDVRTAMVSAHRKFGTEPSIDIARNHIQQYLIAQRSFASMISYEAITTNTKQVVSDLGVALNYPIDAQIHLDRVSKISPPSEKGYSKSSLLHHDHRTNTSPEEWRKALPVTLQKELSKEFYWWFIETGYSVS